MRRLATSLLLLLACTWAHAGSNGGGVDRIIAGTNVTITPANGVGSVTIDASGGGATDPVVGSTATLRQNNVSTGAYTSNPLMMAANTNTFLQSIIWNLSNGAAASANYVVQGDLSGNTSFYAEFGMNSSKFAQAGVAAQVASMTYVASSDGPLAIWSNINGGLNSSQITYTIFLTSVGVIAGYINGTTGAWTFVTSMTATSASFSGVVQSSNVAVPNGSTMTITGMLFSISSNSVTGSTSTAGTAVTSFSTYTLAANTLSVDDVLKVVCLFKDDLVTVPGTPVSGVYMGATVMGTAAFSNNLQNMRVTSEIQVVQSARGLVYNDATVMSAGQTAAVSVTGGPGINQFVFDPTAAQTFNCKASRASGGTISFVGMRVYKL